MAEGIAEKQWTVLGIVGASGMRVLFPASITVRELLVEVNIS
jgi:hypothetical protein